MKITEALANHVCDFSFSDLPSKVVDLAKIHLLDTIGCGIAGTQTEEGEKIISAIKDFDGNKEITIWGTTVKTNAPFAALINGTTSHSLELDDFGASIHPGATIIPASMAVAEKYGCSGRELITAIALGYDVAIRISHGAYCGVQTDFGWHPTGTCGSFGAAASVGKLLGLNKKELNWALGLAGTYTGGVWAFLADGAMSKRFHAGMAAMNGVIAGHLAKKGFTGPTQILEADFGGFYKTYMRDKYNLEEVIRKLGEDHKIMETGLKLYGCCRGVHGALDGILEMKKKFNLNYENIESITVRVNEHIKRITGKKRIETLLDAQMSLPYGVALAIVKGEVSLYKYSPNDLSNKKIQNLIKKIEMVVDSKLRGQSAILRVKTKDNKTYEHEIITPKGDPSNPLSWDDICKKFEALTKFILGDQKTSNVFDLIKNIESVNNVSELCGNIIPTK